MSDGQSLLLALITGLIGIITFDVVFSKKGVKGRVRGKLRKK